MRPISGRLRAAVMKRWACSRQELGRAAAAILQLHGEAGPGAQTRDRGRAERDDAGLGDLLRECAVQGGRARRSRATRPSSAPPTA